MDELSHTTSSTASSGSLTWESLEAAIKALGDDLPPPPDEQFKGLNFFSSQLTQAQLDELSSGPCWQTLRYYWGR